jgi:hypothetical protein
MLSGIGEIATRLVVETPQLPAIAAGYGFVTTAAQF